MIEIVVNHFSEDLDWLRHFPEASVTIYSKGAPLRPPVPAMVVPLANRGREAGTFLFHIASQYDDLSDVTMFLQGDPLPHCPIWMLRGAVDIADRMPGYVPLSAGFGTDDRHGQPNNWRERIPVGELYERAFRRPGPSEYKFACGGMFAATRAAIHSKPREWWALFYEICEREYAYTYAWAAERLWKHLITEEL